MSGEAGYFSPASLPAPQVLRISLICSSSNVLNGTILGKWVVYFLYNPSPGLPRALSWSRVATLLHPLTKHRVASGRPVPSVMAGQGSPLDQVGSSARLDQFLSLAGSSTEPGPLLDQTGSSAELDRVLRGTGLGPSRDPILHLPTLKLKALLVGSVARCLLPLASLSWSMLLLYWGPGIYSKIVCSVAQLPAFSTICANPAR